MATSTAKELAVSLGLTKSSTRIPVNIDHHQIIVYYLLLHTRKPGRCRREPTRNVESAECALLHVNCTIKMAQSTSMVPETNHVLVHTNLYYLTPYSPQISSLTFSQLTHLPRSVLTWRCFLTWPAPQRHTR